MKISDLDEEYFLSGKILHLDGHEIEAAIWAAKKAREKRIKVVLDPDVIISEIDELVKLEMGKKRYKKLPKFPEVVLALACVVDEAVSVKEVRDFISTYSSYLIEKVELFDIYRGKPLPEGKKNLAFNVCYRKKDRTLTEKEANEIHEAIAKRIREHGWELR